MNLLQINILTHKNEFDKITKNMFFLHSAREVQMKRKCSAILITCFMVLLLTACGSEQVADLKALKTQAKTFVGSETCKMCHLEHFDSWMMTLHSRMTQDAQKNKDVIIADLDEKRIRADLAKIDKLKVPADQIYIPKIEEIVAYFNRKPIQHTIR